jgi:TRAP-type C4-dicarboxylate transport system permease small subunit
MNGQDQKLSSRNKKYCYVIFSLCILFFFFFFIYIYIYIYDRNFNLNSHILIFENYED